MSLIIGIDPGKSGGIAWSDGATVESFGMPQSDIEIIDDLRELGNQSFLNNGTRPPCVFLEKVGGFIGKPQPGSAMFKFGRGYGFLMGAMLSMGWEIHLVTPQKWQKALSLGKRGERSPVEWKRHLKDEAARLFPSQKVTLKTADALLILRYAKEFGGTD